MMQKKKICFIAQFPPPLHGLSKAVSTLYDSKLKHEFIFEKIDITNNKYIIKNLVLISNNKADLFYFTISQTKLGNIRDLAILKLLILQHKKCIIHLHGGYYRQLVENDLPTWQKKVNYKLINQLDGVIVLSNALKNIFKGMISENKIHVVMNCVDDTFLLTDSDLNKKMNVLQHQKIIHVLYLSNFIQTKGYFSVLEIAKLEKENVLAGKNHRFHFDFAGKFFRNSDRRLFDNFINENGLEDYITYHGIVDGQQKQTLLGQCHIFILLTRYHNEGQPISILEAMGNAMTIITTDHAGIPDIIKDGINGIVCKSDMGIETIYKKMQCLDNRELIKTGNINRTYCKEMFNQEKHIESIKLIFNDLINIKKK